MEVPKHRRKIERHTIHFQSLLNTGFRLSFMAANTSAKSAECSMPAFQVLT